MQFGIFDYIDDRGDVLQKTYEDRLALLQAAEAAGFYGYHLTEHHATPLSMTPSPSIFLAAAARETQRIRLGTLVSPATFRHPSVLAKSAATADHVSGGRIELGGQLPVLTSGGGLSEAYVHGFNLLLEGVRQIRGTSVNQVPGCAATLVTGASGVATSAVVLREQ